MYTYEKPDNLVDWFESSVKKYANNKLFVVNTPENPLFPFTYREIGDRVDKVRGALSQLGIKKGDAVGIISKNRPEWVIVEFAVYGCGGHYIPMYEKELFETWKYIVTDGPIKFLFVADMGIYEKVKGFLKDIPTLEKIFVIDSDGENSLAALEKMGESHPVVSVKPSAEEMAVIIYTSGTTGEPKGVELTHGNLTYCSRSGYRIYPELNETKTALSMLPWAHSYALSGELHNWIQFGGTLGFMNDVSTLPDDLKRVRPLYLISVPRVFNKIYNGIQTKMNDAGGLKKKLFDAACAVAKDKRILAQNGKSSMLTNIKFFFLDKLVFSKIREGLGGRLEGSLTASAATNVEIANFFYDIGTPIYDCYGLSETSPAVTMNCSAAHRLGSLGKVLAGQKVVIDKSVTGDEAEDGEILISGPNVMKGYHNKPEETAKVLSKDGWFRTGDRGRFDAEGYLYITGRIKEQYKLQNGKYVFPAAIEEEIKLMPSVANAMVYGDGKEYNVCIVFPDFDYLKKYVSENKLPSNPEELVKSEKFTSMMEERIKVQLRKIFGGYEIPKKFHFITEDFTLDNGMLTQTMKLKRRNVLQHYEKDILELYK
ncbi:MAG TPA: long-chain fatty acid--CoA ligase [Spirochaetota bacterium]|nr:long-chain fatty acid--CoA ligase [Spirochaetota bacterium]HPS85692.1 long-chain fatty acid--CoA ligase [Spirochaetota bacterium]